jgi:uncharacterized protein YndB with AHSA1/START domain
MSLASAAERPWALDREIVIAGVYEAPRALVFKMWTDPDHAMKWFGPKGFTCTLHEMDVRVGGRWRFDMKAPNGTVYPNRIEYLEIVANEARVRSWRRHRQRSEAFSRDDHVRRTGGQEDRGDAPPASSDEGTMRGRGGLWSGRARIPDAGQARRPSAYAAVAPPRRSRLDRSKGLRAC